MVCGGAVSALLTLPASVAALGFHRVLGPLDAPGVGAFTVRDGQRPGGQRGDAAVPGPGPGPRRHRRPVGPGSGRAVTGHGRRMGPHPEDHRDAVDLVGARGAVRAPGDHRRVRGGRAPTARTDRALPLLVRLIAARNIAMGAHAGHPAAAGAPHHRGDAPADAAGRRSGAGGAPRRGRRTASAGLALAVLGTTAAGTLRWHRR